MTDSDTSANEAVWRRRFAARANNRAWSLCEQSSRTPEEDLQMLDAAHAARHLWSEIGTERNLALAQLLLGQVHALLGNADSAMRNARAAHAYLSVQGEEACDRAIAHAVLAAAAHCAGDLALHQASYHTAMTLMGELQHDKEKEIVQATLNVIPKPSGDPSDQPRV